MSIKTLFQNIADAIKVKDTSIISLTPSQMPNSILNIPTGGLDSIHFVDFLKVYTKYITDNVSSSTVGNVFNFSENVKMSKCFVKIRSNVTIDLKLVNMSTSEILKTVSANLTTGSWNSIDFEYELTANVNYGIYAVSPTGGVFLYAPSATDLRNLSTDVFNFVEGRYGGILGSSSPDWCFSVIPDCEK